MNKPRPLIAIQPNSRAKREVEISPIAVFVFMPYSILSTMVNPPEAIARSAMAPDNSRKIVRTLYSFGFSVIIL